MCHELQQLRCADGQWVAHGNGRPLAPPGSVPQRPIRPLQAVTSLAWVQPPSDAASSFSGSHNPTNNSSSSSSSSDKNSSLGYEDANAGGVLLTAGADGTARLWQCRTRCYYQDFTSPSSAFSKTTTNAAAGANKTAATATATKSAGGSSSSKSSNNTAKPAYRYRWRSPLCVGQLNSHLPQSIPPRSAPPLQEAGAASSSSSGAELPWLFDGGSEGSNQSNESSSSNSDKTPADVRSEVTTAADAERSAVGTPLNLLYNVMLWIDQKRNSDVVF